MKYLLTCLLSFSAILITSAQEIGYEISPTYRKSIKKEKLSEAKTLKDINPDFPDSWIESYHSIEVSASCNSALISIVSEMDQLNDQQLSLIRKADIGTDIHFSVNYTPKNSTPNNKREIKFDYRIVPELEAKFSDDYQDLKDYLKIHLIDKLSKEVRANLENATVKFTIGEDGRVINPLVEISSKNEKVDDLLIDMIMNMSTWKPAELKNGTKIKQDFVLTIGTLIGC